MSEKNNDMIRMPLLALRGLTVFPGMLLTFDVERAASIGALAAAGKRDQLIFLSAQKDIAVDLPDGKDIYSVGTVCRIRQQLRQPQGGICRVMVEGLYRAEAVGIHTDPKGYSAILRPLQEKEERAGSPRTEALMRSCVSLFQEYLQLNPEMPGEQILNVLANPNPAYVSDYIAQNVHFHIEEKQELLEETGPARRLALLIRLLNKELSVLTIEKELNDQTQEAMSRGQREYYLREEMKIIQAELGEDRRSGRFRRGAREAPKGAWPPAEAALWLCRGGGDPGLPGHLPGAALGQEDPGDRGHRQGPQDPGRRAFRPGKGQGTDPGVHGCEAAGPGGQGRPAVPGGPSGHRQDQHRHERGPCHRAEAGAGEPGRHP